MSDAVKGGLFFAGMFLVGAYNNWGKDGAMFCAVSGILLAGFCLGLACTKGGQE